MSAPAKPLYELDLDEKEELWRAASWIWGALVILLAGFLLAQSIFFSLWWWVLLAVFGLVLSLRSVVMWMKGELAPPEPEPMSVKFSDTPENKGSYGFQIYGKQKTRLGPKIKRDSVSMGQYLIWYLTVRLPGIIGDRLLSGLWTVAGPPLTPFLSSNPFAAGASLRKGGKSRATPYGKEPTLSEQAAELGLTEDSDEIDNPYVGDF